MERFDWSILPIKIVYPIEGSSSRLELETTASSQYVREPRQRRIKTGSGESRMSNKEVGHFKPRYLQHVGKELYLFDSVLNGNTYVHVRELKNERATPTRNGVTLTLTEMQRTIIPSCRKLLYASINYDEMSQRYIGVI